MEAIPAGGIVDIISTIASFAALTENGEVRSWGASRLLGQPHLRVPPNVEIIRATDGAFAALHKEGSVSVWGNPIWEETPRFICSTMAHGQLNNHVCREGRPCNSVLGFHTGILTPCCYPAGELGHPEEFTEPCRRKEWGLEASVVWSEGAANLLLKYPPRPN